MPYLRGELVKHTWRSGQLASASVSSAAEYQTNFAMLKKRQKQSEKLPEFYKVDCVHVSAAPFKAAVEDQIQRLSDTLLVAVSPRYLSPHDEQLELPFSEVKNATCPGNSARSVCAISP